MLITKDYIKRIQDNKEYVSCTKWESFLDSNMAFREVIFEFDNKYYALTEARIGAESEEYKYIDYYGMYGEKKYLVDCIEVVKKEIWVKKE